MFFFFLFIDLILRIVLQFASVVLNMSIINPNLGGEGERGNFTTPVGFYLITQKR